mmetsp:Transcript_37378/g.110337  ORF Transcript_37378/g.110337 Transcript_37378/m.110337 type:complete len:234 (-) Transcript_37378:540-1241(-)
MLGRWPRHVPGRELGLEAYFAALLANGLPPSSESSSVSFGARAFSRASVYHAGGAGRPAPPPGFFAAPASGFFATSGDVLFAGPANGLASAPGLAAAPPPPLGLANGFSPSSSSSPILPRPPPTGLPPYAGCAPPCAMDAPPMEPPPTEPGPPIMPPPSTPPRLARAMLMRSVLEFSSSVDCTRRLLVSKPAGISGGSTGWLRLNDRYALLKVVCTHERKGAGVHSGMWRKAW